MRMNRRRFLAISACALGTGLPALAAAPLRTWRSRALGTDVSVTVSGLTENRMRLVTRRIARELAVIEGELSLFADSSLVRLNRLGMLRNPGEALRAVFRLADAVHGATGGAFDPTVQAIWSALEKGSDGKDARRLAGWSKVIWSRDEIRLGDGMQLTFNGIAQGYAADQVARLLRQAGLGDVLVDMGEVHALGRFPGRDSWQIPIADARGGLLGRVELTDRALATSSPGGQLIGRSGQSHIMHPDGRLPRWHTVTVSAPNAALADGLSTAFCLMSEREIGHALGHFPETRLEIRV